jgi:hypothetical protein
VGWSSDAAAVGKAVAAMKTPASTAFKAELIVMGAVGNHGTVLAGKDYADFPLI